MQRAYTHRSGDGGQARQSNSTFRPRQQPSPSWRGGGGSGGSWGGRGGSWQGGRGGGSGSWGGGGGSWGGHGYRRRIFDDYHYRPTRPYYPIYDTTTWLGSYGYDRLAPEILYPSLYWPTQTYYVTTSATVEEPVENVRISSDPRNNITEWNALPNTAIHYGPSNRPTFLFCDATLKPVQVVDTATGTLRRPILQIDSSKYQCQKQ